MRFLHDSYIDNFDLNEETSRPLLISLARHPNVPDIK